MDEREVLWGMYQEHCVQGRHHENQRSSVTNLIITIAASVVALLSISDFVTESWPLALVLVLLGIMGALFSLKHYERFRFHMKCAGAYRDALEQMLPATALSLHRRAARAAHGQKFRLVRTTHLFVFWVLLNLAIAALGAVLLVFPLNTAGADTGKVSLLRCCDPGVLPLSDRSC